MKVCILMPVLDPYKGGNHLPLFAMLKEVSFTVVCNRTKIAPEDLPDNVEVVTVPGRTGSYYYGCSDYRFASLVLNAFPAHGDFWQKFDVIHINQTMGPALRKLKRSGTPVVFTIHHPVTADLEVAVAESSFVEGMRWRLKYALLKRWQAALCKHVTMVMTVSETMRSRIASDYQLSKTIIEVVPNGVNGDVFTTSNLEPTTDVIAIGSFVHPRKGFRYLCAVYKELAQRGYTIADVGRRSEQQAQQLKDIHGVTMYGTVSEQELLQQLQGTRVLVSTSLFEGFGLSLIEALACGHPGFAFAVGAVPEVLEPIDPNLVVPSRDTKELVSRVDDYLKQSKDEQMAKGKNYRKQVLKLYSLENSAISLGELYAKCSKR